VKKISFKCNKSVLLKYTGVQRTILGGFWV
jgi:hypothetical protein